MNIAWEAIAGILAAAIVIVVIAVGLVSCEMSNQQAINEFRMACVKQGGTYIRNGDSPGNSGGHCFMFKQQ